jgi:hypothetical protein
MGTPRVVGLHLLGTAPLRQRDGEAQRRGPERELRRKEAGTAKGLPFFCCKDLVIVWQYVTICYNYS